MTGGDLLPRTGVWWDLNTCPVPEGVNPRSVRGSIESALRKYFGEPHRITICAVGNLEYVSSPLLEGISDSGMLIKHAIFSGNEIYRLLYEWSRHTPPPAKIMLISSKPSWFIQHSLIGPSGYTVLRAFPENQRPALLPSSHDGKWDWETLLKENSKKNSVVSVEEVHSAWFCYVCDSRSTFPSCSSFLTHLKSTEHRQNLYDSVTPDENGVPVRFCKLCKYPGYDDFNMDIHNSSNEHKQKVNEIEKKTNKNKLVGQPSLNKANKKTSEKK